jgi:hypothetical protein
LLKSFPVSFRLWVPFCKKYNIEPRNPEQYFGQNIDFTAKQIQPDFVKSRRKVKVRRLTITIVYADFVLTF